LGIELQAVVGLAVGHIEYMDHSVAFLGGVHHARFGKVYPFAFVLHPFGKTAQMPGVIFKVVSDDTDVFVYLCNILHFG
jgi:hypothetical protein